MRVKLNPQKKGYYNEFYDFRLNREYIVLSVEGDSYRLLPDIEGPFLYPKDLFLVTDENPTLGWNKHQMPDFVDANFFEDYFDNCAKTINKFNNYLTLLEIQPERLVTEDGEVIFIYRVEAPEQGTYLTQVHLADNLPDNIFEEKKLLPQKNYFVLGIEGDYFCILNELGDPQLYDKSLFATSDMHIPNDWTETYRHIKKTDKKIEIKRYFPIGLNALNFWHRYINLFSLAVKAFNIYYGPLGVPIYRIIQLDGRVVKINTPQYYVDEDSSKIC